MHHYRFHLQRLASSRGPRFQLRIGMDGEEVKEFVPAHRTAFAPTLGLVDAHPTQADVALEVSRVLEWLDGRQA